MYYLLGKDEVVKNTALLASTVYSPIKTQEELKNAYGKFIQSIWVDKNTLPDFSDQFCYNKDKIEELIQSHVAKCDLTDIVTSVSETSLASMQEGLAHIKIGIEYIKSVDLDLYEIFELIIHTIFYTKSPDSGGGSASNHIGVIWCSNRKSWSINDTAEFLVHEFSHNLLFLDERRFKHYQDLDLIASPDNYTLSAVLKINRPLDKTFHSLLVAHELIQFRIQTGEPKKFSIHPSTAKMIENSINTIESIYNLLDRRSDLVHERFYFLLDLITSNIYKIKENYLLRVTA